MRKRKSIFNSVGFTLLELIIVFTVISILSTIGIASFVDYSRVQVVQSAGSNLEATINMAKSRALSQTKPAGCESQVLQGYEVVIDTVNKPNSYTIWAVCSDSLANPFGASTNKVSLPTSVNFDLNKTTTNTVFFPVLTGGIKGGGVIALTGYGQSRCVSMGGGSLVQLQISTCAPIATLTPTPIATFNSTPTPTPTTGPTASPTPVPTPTAKLFVYTGNVQTWTVPAGVTKITVDALGAAGKTAPTSTNGVLGGKGGYGGQAKGTFTVTSGQAVYVYVGASSGYNGGGTGAAGNGGSAGGSGGGASDIRLGGTALSNRILIAAGGGGGGSYYQTTAGAIGGTGGGLSGGAGNTSTTGGKGGTQTVGGNGGAGSYSKFAGNGILGTGGNGIANYSGGGGGGGGYYGGGGGAGGGGGGGSSFVSSSATNTSIVSGVEQYYGQVTISY